MASIVLPDSGGLIISKFVSSDRGDFYRSLGHLLPRTYAKLGGVEGSTGVGLHMKPHIPQRSQLKEQSRVAEKKQVRED